MTPESAPSPVPSEGPLDHPGGHPGAVLFNPSEGSVGSECPRLAIPRHPLLYQINAREWMTDRSRALGRRATLDDVPDGELDRLAAFGLNWVWLMGVWQTGAAGQQVSRSHPSWRAEAEETLPDLRDDDIAGSPFAITGYTASTGFGGDAALARLRQRLHARGLRLMLDFVPNHTALDHPWVTHHPDYYIAGTELDLYRAPGNWARAGGRVLAHGRDPSYPGWPDTLQLDYSNRATREAMQGQLLEVAARCDGARCDMAMLVLPEVFERTWARQAQAFWPRAIPAVKERFPDFLFLAEVYWDLEWELQRQGFDYTYDKRLYDRLRAGSAGQVRDHLRAGLEYQDRLARFLENHGEARAAATFTPGQHEAAAALTYLSPGMRFFHQGQFQGRKKRVSPHLLRAPDEPVAPGLVQFYDRLLAVLRRPAARQGEWWLLECAPAWPENGTWADFVAMAWQCGDERLVVAVNNAPSQGQCYVRLPFEALAGGRWRFQDQFGPASYDRDGDDLTARGLYLDVPGWQAHAFTLERAEGR